MLTWNTRRLARPMFSGRMSPEGASRTSEATMRGNVAAKLAAMPPPSEYPTRLKPLSPVHGSGDEASASRICEVKRRVS